MFLERFYSYTTSIRATWAEDVGAVSRAEDVKTASLGALGIDKPADSLRSRVRDVVDLASRMARVYYSCHDEERLASVHWMWIISICHHDRLLMRHCYCPKKGEGDLSLTSGPVCKLVHARTPHIQGRSAGDTRRHGMPAQMGHERLRQGGAVLLTGSGTMQEPSSVSAVTEWVGRVLPEDCAYLWPQRCPVKRLQGTTFR